MHWKIGEYSFNANTNVLTLNEQVTILEPKVADLLRFFCLNPQRDISRDELMEQVWQGHIVSDSAINRIIVKLRKALGDNDKIKHFIVTVPKVGYRFAASVSVIEQTPLTDAAVLTEHKKKSPLVIFPVILLIAMLVLLAFFLFPFGEQQLEQPEQQAKVSPLLRLSMTQSEGAVSTNGRFLAFVAPSSHGAYQLHVKDTISGVTHLVSPGEGDATSPYWTDDNSGLYYLYYSERGCEIHLVEVEQASFNLPKVIYDCGWHDIKNVLYHPPTNELILVERNKMYTPFQVFGLSLDDKQKRKLIQPEAVGIGNHYIDRDRQSNKLLLLHDPIPSKTALFELDLDKSLATKILTLPYNVTSALWNHNATGVVHPSEHPSYHLMETDLTTGRAKLLVTDSRRVADINRMANQKDYLFTSYIYNRDIRLNGDIDPLTNSSVMDYLPSLSRDGSKLAFVSKRDGYSKVFIMQVGEQSLTSIELPDKGRLFYDLVWSFDDNKLLANTNQGIIVYDLKQQKVEQVFDMPSTVVGAGWYDFNHIHYSVKEDEQWQVVVVDLDGKVTQRLDRQKAFLTADYHQGKLDYVWFDQTLSASWREKPLTNTHCGHVLVRFRLSYQLSDGVVYCRSRKESAILRIDQNGSVTTYQHTEGMPYHFSVSNGNWATWYVSSNVSDLIRTNF